MPGAVLIPIKSFDLAKGRLAASVDPAERSVLAKEMAATVIRAAGTLPVWVVCGDHAVADFARANGADVIWRKPNGLNSAIADGTADLEARGVDRAIIAHILAANRVDHHFTAIVGYAEVPLDRQKPAPDGLFRAIEILGVEEPGSALFIGDHETDTICAANANRDLTALGHELRFRSVAANFLVEDAGSRWTSSPDHQVNRPSELGKLIADLRVHLLNG